MPRSRSLTQTWFALFGWAGAARGKNGRQQPATPAADAATSALAGMTRHEFEGLLGEAFRLQGYQVVPADGAGAGAGVDMVLRRDRQTHLVRCRQWQAHKLGVEVVHELANAMRARGAAGGFVVTSGRFSREANAFASASNIRLIEGPALTLLVRKAQAARAGGTPRG